MPNYRVTLTADVQFKPFVDHIKADNPGHAKAKFWSANSVDAMFNWDGTTQINITVEEIKPQPTKAELRQEVLRYLEIETHHTNLAPNWKKMIVALMAYLELEDNA